MWYSRSRVVYPKKEKNYWIYHDACIGVQAGTMYDLDEHYQCAKCNTLYIEDDEED